MEVALEPPPGGVRRCDDAAAGGADLGLLPLALGHVRAGKQDACDAPLVEDRRRSPRHGPLASVACEPAGLPLGLRHAVRRARDRHERGELVVAGDELQEGGSFELFHGSTEDLAEGTVRTLRDDDRLVIRDDDEARDRVRDGAREVPLALQLDLASLAVRDVDPPAMIRMTSPFASTRGAVRQAITRCCPRASVKTFSYSVGA